MRKSFGNRDVFHSLSSSGISRWCLGKCATGSWFTFCFLCLALLGLVFRPFLVLASLLKTFFGFWWWFCLRICFSKTVLCSYILASFSGVPFCFVIFFKELPKKGLKMEGRAFSTAPLIDEMFPLPLQLFRPFSLENSQWHPVRFASWFICHISFISLNSLYLSSGPMHLSCAPQQCLQGQIQTHFTRHAAARLFHLGCVGWMKNLLSSVVNFFLLTPPSFCRCQCQESPPHRLLFPYFLSPSSGLCWTLKIAKEASLWPGKGCFVEDEWLTQLGEYGNDVLMLPTGQVKSIYLWGAFNKTSSSQGGVSRNFIHKN